MTTMLPDILYTAAQSRELDRLAMEGYGLGDGILMARAGGAAYRLLRRRWPRARTIAVVCGPGNNGGDGYVLARLASVDGISVRVLVPGDPSAPRGDALVARKALEQTGQVISPFSSDGLNGCDLVVDAMFGTGLERELSGPWREAVDAINAASATGVPVLALDVPSGLNADRGVAPGVAVRATETLTFISIKAGLLTADGPDYCGRLVFDSLDLPAEIYERITPFARRLTSRALAPLIPRRPRNSHKGQNGRVLMVGGGPGMPGAIRLAGEAALYTGAGRVTVATHPGHTMAVNGVRPELIVNGVVTGRDLRDMIAHADVVAIGPGLGHTSWARDLMSAVLECELPVVVDADALGQLAVDPVFSERWVLTPHPGEAARLLSVTTQEIQRHRFDSADRLVQQYGGVCVLKGAGSLVVSASSRFVCDRGNPALATAGSGDLLTGAIASLIAQGLSNRDAARVAVWCHARAAERLVRRSRARGMRGWLASEFLPTMREALHMLESEHDDE